MLDASSTFKLVPLDRFVTIVPVALAVARILSMSAVTLAPVMVCVATGVVPVPVPVDGTVVVGVVVGVVVPVEVVIFKKSLLQ